jgi:hypothetical protein
MRSTQATLVIGNGSAVVDDFELMAKNPRTLDLIDEMASHKPARPSTLEMVSREIRRARRNQGDLERISSTYALHPIRDGESVIDPVAILKHVGTRVEEATVETIRSLVH